MQRLARSRRPLEIAVRVGNIHQPVVFGVQLCFFLLLDRAVVFERYDLHCNGCGYDLRGQVAPRCPECGAAMDDAQRRILETGRFDPMVIRRRRTVSLGFVVFLVALGMSTISLILITLFQWSP